MANLEERKSELRSRLARKKAEVQAYLDDKFYRAARDILKRAESMDRHGSFRADPSGLPEYYASVKKPMYWALIAEQLNAYTYATPQAFMEDMRRVVDNCYAYNGDSSKFSVLARNIEIEMEDAFVKELGEAPPSIMEMKTLSKKLTPQTSRDIIHIFNLYEKREAKTHDTKASISLPTCRCATKRRILQLMRDAVQRKEAKAAPPKAPPRKAAAPPAVKMPVKRPAGLSAPSGPAFAHTTAAAEVVQAADDVSFHNEEPPVPTTHLERVPQNARTDTFTLRDISPARLEESFSDEDDSGTMTGSSGFAPVDSTDDEQGVRRDEEAPTDLKGGESSPPVEAPPLKHSLDQHDESGEADIRNGDGNDRAVPAEPVPPTAVAAAVNPTDEESLQFNNAG